MLTRSAEAQKEKKGPGSLMQASAYQPMLNNLKLRQIKECCFNPCYRIRMNITTHTSSRCREQTRRCLWLAWIQNADPQYYDREYPSGMIEKPISIS